MKISKLLLLLFLFLSFFNNSISMESGSSDNKNAEPNDYIETYSDQEVAVYESDKDEIFEPEGRLTFNSLPAEIQYMIIKEHVLSLLKQGKNRSQINQALKNLSLVSTLFKEQVQSLLRLNADLINNEFWKKLVEAEKYVKEKGSREITQELTNAAEDNNIEQVRFLILGGTDLNVQGKFHKTALICAAEEGNTEIVNLLIQAGVDLNITDRSDTALICAAEKGYAKIVNMLVHAGADLNVQDLWGKTALIEAASNGHTQIVNILVRAGADLNVQTQSCNTALMSAVHHGHTEIVKILTATESKSKVENTGYKSDKCEKLFTYFTELPLELQLMILNSDLSSIKSIEKAKRAYTLSLVCKLFEDHISRSNICKLSAQEYVKEKSSYKITQELVNAAQENNIVHVKFLISGGANPNPQTVHRNSALTSAAKKGHTEIVNILIQAGANIDVKDQHGHTALILAVIEGHTEIVNILIKAGANLNAKNEAGYAALFYANRVGHIEIANILVQAGAKS